MDRKKKMLSIIRIKPRSAPKPTLPGNQTSAPCQTPVSWKLGASLAARLLPLFLLVAPPVASKASDYLWMVENDGITITDYTGPGGAVMIPDVIYLLPVTRIDDFAFSSKPITSITMPDTVTSLGNYAFSHCPNLTSVTIGNGVTTIGDYAFYRCTSLSDVPVGDSVNSIGVGAFISCDALAGITIPPNVTSIGDGAFRDCPSLTEIVVDPSNLLFSSLEGLLLNNAQTTLIQCPEGKTGRCRIPGSVTRLGDFAFESCTNLNNLYFEGNAPGLGQSVFLNVDNSTAYYLSETTGWSASYGGLPTAVWQPELLTEDGLFGVTNDQFGFTICWASDHDVLVEGSTDLAIPAWETLETVPLTTGSYYFSDPGWTNHPNLFYRIRTP